MATYYKYAERSADSQINWAEVGKNMSDMLKEETRIREEKKTAIDAASREFGQTLANPPQGEHKGANQWALEYADNASQFMLMQDRLLKSGQMKLKDYTVARQNILDGTDNAFNLTKDYQAVFADKMERYKTDKSQDLEQWLMGQVEGYSDFNKSQLYINPTDGTLSVAMKEKKIVDGKEVYVMNKNPNQFTSISTLKNQIAGKYDKFNTNAATDVFVKGLGEEVTSAITKAASLSGGGLIQTIEDIRNRKDIDPATKQILYQFSDSENQFIKSTLVNPYDRLSVLTNSKKFAPNGMQYGFTNDAAEAKSNPNKILLKVDPSSGQPTPQFSDEQIKVSEDFIRTELRAKYTRKEELKPTPQAQLQERRAPTGGEIDERNRIADAKNFAENMATALTGKDPVAIKNAISYLANKSGKKVDRTATGLVIKNSDGTNESTYNFLENGKVTDPKKLTKAMVSAFGTALPEDKIVQFANQFIGGNQLETKTSASGFKQTLKPAVVDPMTVYGKHIDTVIADSDVAGLSKGEAADALNAKLSGLGVKVKSSLKFNDDVYIVNDDKKESPAFNVKNAGTVDAIKKWIKANPSGGTPVQKAANIKALVKSGVITSGAGELDD
jgi:molybdopterin converting factor small subunit